MKLRVKGNSLRLRLTRPEVVRLREDGLVEESADFGAGATFVYRVMSVASHGPVRRVLPGSDLGDHSVRDCS
ncbi:MAG TPA: hypothetical protein PKJ41_11040, partial [Bryobacteraceae bacterium]|nr:hypothetical protein [Bryobacteraceae bacterium]